MRVPPEVVAAVREAHTVLLATHSPMDGDGLGCGLALMRVLEALGKRCRFVTEAWIPHAYAFLPGYERIERLSPGDPVPAADLVIGLDAGEADRLGRPAFEGRPPARLVNIDHHVSNRGYGELDWIEPDAAATGEQVFALLQALGVGIDPQTALCLLVAIVTDTGRFCYSNTTPHTLECAAALVRLGAEPDLLQRRLFGAVPIEVLRLHARAVDRIAFASGGRVAVLAVAHDFGADLGAGEEELKDLVDVVVAIRGVVVAALVRGLPEGGAKVSLRSKSDRADVSAFAATLGGGGHVRAAGFASDGDPAAVAAGMLPGLEALAVAAGE